MHDPQSTTAPPVHSSASSISDLDTRKANRDFELVSAQIPVSRVQSDVELAVAQAKQRTVVEHLAAVVAPDGVGHPSRAQLGHVAGNQAVQT